MKFLSSSPGSRKFVILAPSGSAVPRLFSEPHTDSDSYETLLAEMQRMRGRIYLQDGAIEADQLTDGRHQLDIDRRSWHLLLLDKDDCVAGCARYREYRHRLSFGELGVSHSALANCDQWGGKLAGAVEAELAMAKRLNLPYVELGGWALIEQVRGTSEALRMALATYCLAQSLGGGVGISTVTRRYCSSSILRRIGGRTLEHGGVELPAYYDPQYKCEMEILRFYSWAPNPRYRIWIHQIKPQLQAAPVLSDSGQARLRLSSIRPGASVSPARPLLATS